MTKGVLCGFVLVLPALLAGCASSNIRPEDMSKLGAAPTQADIDKIAHGNPIHRVDYLVDGHGYSFEVYEAADTARYYQLLFQDGKLIALDMASVYVRDVGPGICMMFPASPGLDVEDCLRTEDQALQAASVDLHQPVTPDQKTLHREKTEATGAVVETVTYAVLLAPLLVPAAVLSLPLIAAENSKGTTAQQALGVKLGDSYQDIQARVEQLPARDRSMKDGEGTVLVAGGATSIPTAAFGVQGGKVIWLELDPPWECGNGFMLWGAECRVRTHAPEAWHARQEPRPAVLDEWENLAIYYTPPPQFEVLGETRGEARGFTSKGRMESAVEDMKKEAFKDGATAVLMNADARPFTAAPAPATGTPVYGPSGEASSLVGWVEGVEIYVPADADAFQKAAHLHASACDALSKKKDAADDAYDAVKDAKGTPEALAAAKQALQAAKDAKDAAYCGDDDWYAEQMVGHEL